MVLACHVVYSDFSKQPSSYDLFDLDKVVYSARVANRCPIVVDSAVLLQLATDNNSNA